MARTVLDAAVLHEAIGGHDRCDSTSIDAPAPVLVKAVQEGARGGLAGLRVGVVRELGGDGHTEGYDAGVLDRVRETVELLAGMGAEGGGGACPGVDPGLARSGEDTA